MASIFVILAQFNSPLLARRQLLQQEFYRMLTPKLEEAYNISMNLLFGGVIVVQLMNRKTSKQLYDNYLLATESDPVGIQTQDLQNRNLTLYSTKLRDQSGCKGTNKREENQILFEFSQARVLSRFVSKVQKSLEFVA